MLDQTPYATERFRLDTTDSVVLRLGVTEKRRFARAPMDQPLVFRSKIKETLSRGIGKDISVGGMFVETQTPLSFGDEIVVVTGLPGEKGEFTLHGVVRWMKAEGMGVQFGLLGARETHVITEITKRVPGTSAG